jgi:hypothetical protein
LIKEFLKRWEIMTKKNRYNPMKVGLNDKAKVDRYQARVLEKEVTMNCSNVQVVS